MWNNRKQQRPPAPEMETKLSVAESTLAPHLFSYEDHLKDAFNDMPDGQKQSVYWNCILERLRKIFQLNSTYYCDCRWPQNLSPAGTHVFDKFWACVGNHRAKSIVKRLWMIKRVRLQRFQLTSAAKCSFLCEKIFRQEWSYIHKN